MVLIDVTKMLEGAKLRKLGTGTLAKTIGVRPDDIQKVIALGEANGDVATKLVDFFGDVVVVSETEDLDEGMDSDSLFDGTVAQLKARVEDGVISAAELAEYESKRENPRTTLLKWLEEYGE